MANNVDYYKFIGKLYNILISNEILNYSDSTNDLKIKRQRVEKYLTKLKRIQDKTLDDRRHLEELKNLYYDKYVIKSTDIPESYFRFLE